MAGLRAVYPSVPCIVNGFILEYDFFAFFGSFMASTEIAVFTKHDDFVFDFHKIINSIKRAIGIDRSSAVPLYGLLNTNVW